MKEQNKLNILNPKNDIKMLIFYISITIFIILTILIKINIIDSLDSYLESFIISIRNDNLTNIMLIITNIARAYSLIAISILLLFIIKNKKTPILIIINLISVFLTSQIFKLIFGRSRPDGEFLAYATGYSYPSGHAMVSLSYFSFITYLICKNTKSKLFKSTLIIINTIMILSIGFSRIYLGVHYLSDILGGFLLSIAYLMIFIKIIEKNEGKK